MYVVYNPENTCPNQFIVKTGFVVDDWCGYDLPSSGCVWLVPGVFVEEDFLMYTLVITEDSDSRVYTTLTRETIPHIGDVIILNADMQEVFAESPCDDPKLTVYEVGSIIDLDNRVYEIRVY